MILPQQVPPHPSSSEATSEALSGGLPWAPLLTQAPWLVNGCPWPGRSAGPPAVLAGMRGVVVAALRGGGGAGTDQQRPKRKHHDHGTSLERTMYTSLILLNTQV